MKNISFLDEAPDTGDDSDEDLVTNHLINGSGSAVAMENLVPTIHITPQSPNGNHVLEDNLLQLSRIQERIQEMRIANAQGNLNISDNRGRLSTSCPSLNESLEALASGDKTDNANYRSKIRSKNENNANKHQRSKMQHRKHRSVSVSSGDSEDDTDTVDGSAAQKIRQRSASQAPKEAVTPPHHKESRFYHGGANRYVFVLTCLASRGCVTRVNTSSALKTPFGLLSLFHVFGTFLRSFQRLPFGLSTESLIHIFQT